MMKSTMLRGLMILSLSLGIVATATQPVDAGSRKVVRGAVVGAGVGALVGGSDGAAAGAVVGAIAGAN